MSTLCLKGGLKILRFREPFDCESVQTKHCCLSFAADVCIVLAETLESRVTVRFDPQSERLPVTLHVASASPVATTNSLWSNG